MTLLSCGEGFYSWLCVAVFRNRSADTGSRIHVLQCVVITVEEIIDMSTVVVVVNVEYKTSSSPVSKFDFRISGTSNFILWFSGVWKHWLWKEMGAISSLREYVMAIAESIPKFNFALCSGQDWWQEKVVYVDKQLPYQMFDPAVWSHCSSFEIIRNDHAFWQGFVLTSLRASRSLMIVLACGDD